MELRDDTCLTLAEKFWFGPRERTRAAMDRLARERDEALGPPQRRGHKVREARVGVLMFVAMMTCDGEILTVREFVRKGGFEPTDTLWREALQFWSERAFVLVRPMTLFLAAVVWWQNRRSAAIRRQLEAAGIHEWLRERRRGSGADP